MKTISAIVLFTFLASAQCAVTKEKATPPTCAATKDLYTKNGKYLKSLCYVSSKKTFENADAFCKANNMLLFAITTSDQYVALKSAVKSLFNRNTMMQFWINGRQDRNGFWYVYGSKVVKLHDDAVPSYTYKKNTNALSFMVDFVYYYTERESSAKSLPFFCEFSLPTTTTTTTTTRKTTVKTTKIPTTVKTTSTTPTTTEPTTTTATTTTSPFCAKTVIINDASTGVYMKTACIALGNYNYSDSIAKCNNFGFSPLAIETSDEYSAALKYLPPAFVALAISDAWINGYKPSPTSHWFSYTSSSTPPIQIYSGAEPNSPGQGLTFKYLSGFLITAAVIYDSIHPIICEFVDSTMATTPSTTAQTIPSICDASVPINDLSTGTHLKTACIIAQKTDYDSASTMCKANGMYLFAIATNEEYLAFKQLMGSPLAALSITSAWINGVQEIFGSWMYNTGSGPQPLYIDAKPPPSAGNLALMVSSGSIITMALPPTFQYSSVCELV